MLERITVRISGLFAILLIATPFGLQAADTPLKKLTDCAVIKQDKQRLRCYDALARYPVVGKKETYYVRIRTNMKSEWTVSSHDRDDGGRNVFLRVQSRDLWVRSDWQIDASEFAELRPTFWVQCVQGKTTAFVDWGMFLDVTSMKVFVRVDDEPMYNRTLEVDATRQRIGQWNNEIIIKSLKGALHAKILYMKFVPKEQESLIVRFSLEGLDKAIVPLRRACKW